MAIVVTELRGIPVRKPSFMNRPKPPWTIEGRGDRRPDVAREADRTERTWPGKPTDGKKGNAVATDGTTTTVGAGAWTTTVAGDVTPAISARHGSALKSGEGAADCAGEALGPAGA